MAGEPASPSHCLSITLHTPIGWSFKDRVTTESYKNEIKQPSSDGKLPTFTVEAIIQQSISLVTTTFEATKCIGTGVLAATICDTALIYICSVIFPCIITVIGLVLRLTSAGILIHLHLVSLSTRATVGTRGVSTFLGALSTETLLFSALIHI